ncbi:ATP-binding protein, partial [Actinocorallia lasiicapitis]
MGGLIGRARAETALAGEIARVDASHGGLVLIAGEAGIGKSALVASGVAEARKRGALVVSGACWDSGSAPGFWPWTQVVRAVRRHAPSIGRPRALGVLVGEEPGDAELAEFQLFDAVATALVEASQERAVVVVLEDLHWADEASLRLLEFAAQHTWFERLLLVGTYRDDEAEAVGHRLAPLMSPLVAKATTVTLTGLGPEETRALVVRTAGRDPGPELAAEVCRRTGGNPFFIEQTARLWQNGGSPTTIPPGVRDAL